MENRFEITREMMEGASTYIPLVYKTMLAKTIADLVIVPVNKDDTDTPPVYKEDNMLKSVLMMGVLLKFYFGNILNSGDDDSTVELAISEDEFNGWGEAHVMNQIERFKQGEFKSKAFDLLADYKELEKTVNGYIFGELKYKNDPVRRMMEVIISLSDTDSLKKTVEDMKNLSSQMQSFVNDTGEALNAEEKKDE